MKTHTFLLVLAVAAAGVAAVTYENRATSKSFMREKLVYSQGVLEGLTLERFDLVTKNGIKMRKMNLTNLFYVTETPDYMDSLTKYQKATDQMLLASGDKDLKKTTEAYHRVIESCVECHRIFRTVQKPKAAR